MRDRMGLIWSWSCLLSNLADLSFLLCGVGAAEARCAPVLQCPQCLLAPVISMVGVSVANANFIYVSILLWQRQNKQNINSKQKETISYLHFRLLLQCSADERGGCETYLFLSHIRKMSNQKYFCRRLINKRSHANITAALFRRIKAACLLPSCCCTSPYKPNSLVLLFLRGYCVKMCQIRWKY